MKTILILIVDILIWFVVTILVIWGEFKLLFLLFPIMRDKTFSIMFIGVVTFFVMVILNGRIMDKIMMRKGVINYNKRCMKKNELNYNGWDITVSGKKFFERFLIEYTPNMDYVHQLIQNELYSYLAIKYAKQNNLSTDSQQDIDIIEKWTNNSIQEFVEDISTMRISAYRDFPIVLFASLEERINEVMKYAQKDMENITPLSYYKVLQDDERFDYRTKI